MGRAAPLLLVLALFLVARPAEAQDRLAGPWGESKRLTEGGFPPPEGGGILETVLYGLFIAFNRYISPADGPRSLMYPTSSAYGYQAIRRFGLIRGLILTFERILRNGPNAEGFYPLVRLVDREGIVGTWYYYDPVPPLAGGPSG